MSSRQYSEVRGSSVALGPPNDRVQLPARLCGRVSCNAWFGLSLLLPEQQIHHPAAADVWTGAAAMGEDVGVLAAGVLKGVGEDRQAVKGTVVVSPPGE